MAVKDRITLTLDEVKLSDGSKVKGREAAEKALKQ